MNPTTRLPHADSPIVIFEVCVEPLVGVSHERHEFKRKSADSKHKLCILHFKPPEIPTVDDESKNHFVDRTFSTLRPFPSVSTASVAFVRCTFRDFASTSTQEYHSIGIHAEPIDCPFIISACKFIDFTSSGPLLACGCVSIIGTSSPSSSFLIQDTLFERSAVTGSESYAGALRVLYSYSLTIDRCNITSCSTEKHSGGIYIRRVTEILQVSNNRFSDCSTGEYGGGLRVVEDTSFSVTSTRFENCHADVDGGGLDSSTGISSVSVAHSIFHTCTSGHDGGGIQVAISKSSNIPQDFTISVDNCTFDSCSAGNFGGGSSNHSEGRHLSEMQRRKFRSCFFAVECFSVDVEGCVVEDCVSDYVGNIRLWNVTTTSIKSTRFENCSGIVQGGSGIALTHGDNITIKTTNFTKMTGGHNGGARLMALTKNFTLEDCRFEGCVSEREGGAALIACLAESPAAVTLTRLTFIDCHSTSEDSGGIIVFNAVSVNVSGCVVQGCSCSTYGGGLRVHNSASITITDSSFSSNFAGMNGGSVDTWNITTSTLIQNCSFSDSNASNIAGGVVIAQTPNVEVRNCTFTKCRANRGAAVDVVDSISLTLAQLVIKQCSAETVGGGICYAPLETEAATLSVSEMTFGSKSDGMENACGDLGVDLHMWLPIQELSPLLTVLRTALFTPRPTSGYSFAREQRLSAAFHIANTEPVFRTSILTYAHPYDGKEMYVDSVKGLDEPLCGLQILPCATLTRAGEAVPENGTIRIQTKAEIGQATPIVKTMDWCSGDSRRVPIVFFEAGYVSVQVVTLYLYGFELTSSPSATLRTQSLFIVTDGSLDVYYCVFSSIKSAMEGSCISATLYTSGSLSVDNTDFRSCSSSSNGGAMFVSLSESFKPSSLTVDASFSSCRSEAGMGDGLFLEGYDFMTLLSDSTWDVALSSHDYSGLNKLWGTDLSLPTGHRFHNVSLFVYLRPLFPDTIIVSHDGRDVHGCGLDYWPCASIEMAALLPIDEKHITIHILDTIDLYDEVDFDESNVRIEGYSSISSVSLREYAQICVEEHDLVLTHLRFTGTYPQQYSSFLVVTESGTTLLEECRIDDLTFPSSPLLCCGTGMITLKSTNFSRQTRSSGNGVIVDSSVASSDTIQITSSRFTTITATSGSGSVISGSFGNGKKIEITASQMTSCESSGDGGALNIVLSGTATLRITQTDFKKCVAGGNGGALHVDLRSISSPQQYSFLNLVFGRQSSDSNKVPAGHFGNDVFLVGVSFIQLVLPPLWMGSFADANSDDLFGQDGNNAPESLLPFLLQQEVYVGKNGDDITGTGSESSPFLTLATSLQLLDELGQQLNTVTVMEETRIGKSIVLGESSQPSRQIAIVSHDSARARIVCKVDEAKVPGIVTEMTQMISVHHYLLFIFSITFTLHPTSTSISSVFSLSSHTELSLTDCSLESSERVTASFVEVLSTSLLSSSSLSAENVNFGGKGCVILCKGSGKVELSNSKISKCSFEGGGVVVGDSTEGISVVDVSFAGCLGQAFGSLIRVMVVGCCAQVKNCRFERCETTVSLSEAEGTQTIAGGGCVVIEMRPQRSSTRLLPPTSIDLSLSSFLSCVLTNTDSSPKTTACVGGSGFVIIGSNGRDTADLRKVVVSDCTCRNMPFSAKGGFDGGVLVSRGQPLHADRREMVVRGCSVGSLRV
ncbi:hypothetical protein BLNAU_5939 [Blattamonas nauphoetae]|uniref:Right handed beta helix domain-containing protein n=1 Tax=Blattamonas nauphoetae TaxID=2049346 RepID=A0ABQ9Y5Z2_9EUKA|nr:hypothetical protein BLNAU_5939 [Blattamonas nauphoetae]